MPALAQEQAVPAPAEPAATRIEVDEQAGAIRFLIDGQETMRLDSSGLHARESVSFGGVLTDYGTNGFDSHVSESGESGDAR